MPSDAVLLFISISGLTIIVASILFFAGFFQSKRVVDAPTKNDEEIVKAGGRRAAGGGLAALRKRKEKKNNQPQQQQDQPLQQEGPAEIAPEELVGNQDAAAGEGEGAGEIIEPRAMTKKELQKELKRRERDELRRYDEERREEQRKKQDARDEAYQKKRDEESRMELELEEQVRRLAEEKAKKEQEEFDQWKTMFSVEEEGAKADSESEESQMLLQQFVDYIKARKVVLLEDLGAAFNLPTQDAIQRVEALQQANRITGIIDDRGKFIYITEEEMDKVAKFIQRKGRVGLGELARECNKLIRLDGEKDGSSVSATTAVDWLTEVEQQQDQPEEAKSVGTA